MTITIPNLFKRKAKEKPQDKRDASAVDGIDEETLALAKELAFDKRMREVTKTGGIRKRGETEVSGLLFDRQTCLNRLFARTAEDSVLANRFIDTEGRRVGGVTVKRAAAMDGLRDIDDAEGVPPSVGVSTEIASPMNPEGRYALPVARSGTGDIYRRYNEAVNPRNYADIPTDILEHFAQFATFIGYPACGIIAGHPTVSNACSIPGKDAIAVGYKIKFLDSEDMDGNGIPDEEEDTLGGAVELKEVLEKGVAVKSLNDALLSLSSLAAGAPADKHGRADALSRFADAVERVKAFAGLTEEMAKRAEGGWGGGRDERAYLVEALTEALANLTKTDSPKSRTNALAMLGIALKKLGGGLGARTAKAAWEKRKTVSDLTEVLEMLKREPADDAGGEEVLWNPSETLSAIVDGIDRIAAYANISDPNAEVKSELTMAFAELARKRDHRSKEEMIGAVARAIAAMDDGEFAFEDEPTLDGVSKPQEADNADGVGGGAQGGADMPFAGGGEGGATGAKAEGGGPGDPVAEQAMALQAQEAQQKQAEEEAKKKEEEKRKEEKAKLVKKRQKALDQWKKRADDMGLNGICRELARAARTFGVGIAVPVVDGVDYEKEFDINAVKKGAYRGFVVIEPMWIYPEMDGNDLVNPLSPYFFEPKYWGLNAGHVYGGLHIRRIHRSWMVVVRHKNVPDMLRPMYYYGGIPLTQEIYEAVYAADKVMNEVPKLAMCKRTTVVKGSPNDFVTNPEGVVERLKARSQVQDNFGILYVDRNTDVTQLETSLTEFDQLITKCNQRIASIAQMPETKLFKTQLAGMNSAGRYEWDDYAQLLIDIQNNWFVPLLALHYKLDSMSQNGKPIQVRVVFNPIEVQTTQEREQSESSVLQTISGALQSQMITAEEGRTMLRSREEGMFSALPAEMPEELKQAQEQAQQGGGMGGMPGMPGGMPPGMEGGGMPGGMPPGGEGGGDPMAALAGMMGGGNGGGGGAPSGSPLDEPSEPKEPEAPKERK